IAQRMNKMPTKRQIQVILHFGFDPKSLHDTKAAVDNLWRAILGGLPGGVKGNAMFAPPGAVGGPSNLGGPPKQLIYRKNGWHGAGWYTKDNQWANQAEAKQAWFETHKFGVNPN